MLTELLKNAFRATVEQRWDQHDISSARSIPPVLVTVSSPPRLLGVGRPSYLSIRVRDEGGGVAAKNMAKIFSYAFSTAKRDVHLEEETGGGPYAAQQVGGSASLGVGEGRRHGEAFLFGEVAGKSFQTGAGTLAGLGYGLPMSKLYARYSRVPVRTWNVS